MRSLRCFFCFSATFVFIRARVKNRTRAILPFSCNLWEHLPRVEKRAVKYLWKPDARSFASAVWSLVKTSCPWRTSSSVDVGAGFLSSVKRDSASRHFLLRSQTRHFRRWRCWLSAAARNWAAAVAAAELR